VGLESALGPGAVCCRPSPPGWTALPLGTTLCGSPVPAARGSAASWPCSPVTPTRPRPGSLGPPEPCLPRPPGPAHLPAPSGVCRCVLPPGSSPGLGPLSSLSRCQSLIPWKEWWAWPRSPPTSAGRWSDGECGVGATSRGPGHVEGRGLVFRACCFSCFHLPGPWPRGGPGSSVQSLLLRLLEREGPLPDGVRGPLCLENGSG